MEEIYEKDKIVLKLSLGELIRIIRGEILEGYKIKQIGMITEWKWEQ